MTELDWQKSTYSEVASSCIYIATTTPTPRPPTEPSIRLRESDAPHKILGTTPAVLATLISALKGAAP
ncbi:DUF397 domain-containing protein [Streptomyces sp. NPDC050703]|uniref:DUF397 domain-containing protein n=1 Tax=Streptomyces sp. NPDC050703 TaxID=3157218 RepID=UPI0034132B14